MKKQYVLFLVLILLASCASIEEMTKGKPEAPQKSLTKNFQG